MQSGLVYGHMGMVDYIVKRMKKELEDLTPSGKPVKVIATGGLSTMIDEGIDCIDCVDKLLTLEGWKSYTKKIKDQQTVQGEKKGHE